MPFNVIAERGINIQVTYSIFKGVTLDLMAVITTCMIAFEFSTLHLYSRLFLHCLPFTFQ
jgi:hypothetical protein